jgi:hypothetical protein
MCGSISPLPNTSSWHGAQFKKKRNTGTVLPYRVGIHLLDLFENSSDKPEYDSLIVRRLFHSCVGTYMVTIVIWECTVLLGNFGLYH